jgi:hypothetical protein
MWLGIPEPLTASQEEYMLIIQFDYTGVMYDIAKQESSQLSYDRKLF